MAVQSVQFFDKGDIQNLRGTKTSGSWTIYRGVAVGTGRKIGLATGQFHRSQWHRPFGVIALLAPLANGQFYMCSNYIHPKGEFGIWPKEYGSYLK